MNPTPLTTEADLLVQGWKPREWPGNIGVAGPLWTRKSASGWAYGFLASASHLNQAGVVHGGALVTLMDQAISTAAAPTPASATESPHAA